MCRPALSGIRRQGGGEHLRKTIKKRLERREDEGFTLIELMVVVLIIAILIAIAIPTFLGARKRAQDRAAQSNLRNALTAAKTLFTDNESYLKADVSLDATSLPQSEPSLSFHDHAFDVKGGAGVAPPKDIGTRAYIDGAL